MPTNPNDKLPPDDPRLIEDALRGFPSLEMNVLRSRIAALEEERDRLGVWNEKLSIELGCMREETERSRCYRKALEAIVALPNRHNEFCFWCEEIDGHSIIDCPVGIALRAIAPQDDTK